MTRRPLAKALLVASVLFAASPTGAAETMRLSACYEIAWGGISFADLRLSVTAGSDFTAETVIATFGLADLFGPFRFDAMSRGRLVRPDLALPERYVALDGHKPEKRRRTVLSFDSKSGAVAEELMPPRAARVEPRLRTGAVDPLTAVLQARGAIRRSLAGGPTTVILPIYDGSKRYDLELAVLGRVAGPGGLPAIRATGRVRPIAGFRPRQLEHVREPADIYLSDDAFLLPLRVEAGWSSLALVDRRADGQPCRS